MQIFIAKNFRGPPSDRKKISGPPPFLPWKLRVNPIEKHVNSIFNGKSVVIFFRAPLTRVKNFKGPPFCIRPPLTSVCERSLIRLIHVHTNLENDIFLELNSTTFYFSGLWLRNPMDLEWWYDFISLLIVEFFRQRINLHWIALKFKILMTTCPTPPVCMVHIRHFRA